MKNKKLFNLGIFALAVVLMIGGVFVQRVNATITTVTVTDPDGSEIWSGSHDITWTTDGDAGDSVKIYYCSGTNCAENSYTLIVASTTNDGTYSWDTTTAADGDATTYKIRVASEVDPNIADNSNAVFTVDNTVPLISISDDASGEWTNSDTIAVTTSDATAGLLETRWVVQDTATCGAGQDTALDAGTSGTSMVADDDAIYQNKYICFRSKDNADAANKNYAVSAQITKLDTTAPEITSTAPATDASIKEQKVSYTLSEAVTTGTIVFTRTGGAEDLNVHTCALQGTALNTGEHTNLTLETGDNACTDWANPLVDGTIYTVTFDADDAATNSATTITNTGITYDTTAPTIAVDAIVGTTISEAGDTIAITFSEPVVTHDGGAWAVEEMPTISGSVTGALTLTNAAFNYSGSTLTITLDEATDGMYLKNGETLTLTPGDSKIKDAAGNFVAAAEVVGTTAVTGDVVAPTVALTYSPDQTAYKSGDAVTITATFNEDVEDTAGSVPTIAIATAGDGSVTATDMSIGANRKIWTYVWNVPAGDDDDGTATSTIVATDLAGNSNEAATNNTKTIDNTVPTIAVDAIVGTTISEAGDTIAITFSEPVVTHDGGAWAVEEMPTISGSVTGALTLTNAAFNYSGSTLTITLDEATDGMYLKNGETLTLTPGDSKIKDAAGNFVAAAEVVGTTAVTGDVVAPTVALTYSPDRALMGLETVTITATFNEDVDEGVVPTIAIETPGDGDLPATNMTKSSSKIWTYAWQVPGGTDDEGTATSTIVATDLAGNANATATNNTRTIDATSPIVNSFTAESITATSTVLTVVTSENATCAYATTDIAYGDMTEMESTGATTHTQAITGLSGSTYYNYYVRCEDSSNNIMGYSAHVGFTTLGSDSTPPEVSSTYPANGDTGVSINVSPYIQMSESMDIETIASSTVQLRKSSDDSVVSNSANFALQSRTDGGDTILIFLPSGSLTYETDYYLYVAGVKDSAGNVLATPYGSSSTSAFTTEAEGVGTLSIDNVGITKSVAHANGEWSGGWTFNIEATVPNNIEHGIKMIFDDWKQSGATAIPVANNIRFSVDGGTPVTITAAANAAWDNWLPAGWLDISGVSDANSSKDGKQITIKVETKIPDTVTLGGSYSAAFALNAE